MTAHQAHSNTFVILFDGQLTSVHGGQAPTSQQIPALGRCGPADRWRWLGDYYTPECLAHDQAVRQNLDAGSNGFMAHLRALPQLPAAIGSYVRARWNGQAEGPPQGTGTAPPN
jgi:hypothetical protein